MPLLPDVAAVYSNVLPVPPSHRRCSTQRSPAGVPPSSGACPDVVGLVSQLWWDDDFLSAVGLQVFNCRESMRPNKALHGTREHVAKIRAAALRFVLGKRELLLWSAGELDRYTRSEVGALSDRDLNRCHSRPEHEDTHATFHAGDEYGV